MMTPVAETIATPLGDAKSALVPMPSAKFAAAPPPPASVETSPRGVISLTALLSRSATTMTALERMMARPRGLEKDAAVPVPSTKAAIPLPASVETTPSGEIRRMRLFPVSATTITPEEGITAMPRGPEKRAAVPIPFAYAATPLPARVETAPAGVTMRTA